ncbi:MAG TPA: peptidoglycan DD-metalloendopeptidase family protein [Acidimicrobiia bacterium]
MRDGERGPTTDQVWRRLVAAGTAAILLTVAGAAYAADETTTTTQPSTTTTTTQTTTTTEPSTTTTETDPVPEEGDDSENVKLLTPPQIVFPVAGEHSFVDTFGAPRDGGRRQHKGNDIFAAKGTPVVAVSDGTIDLMSTGDLAGQYVALRHNDGWRSMYMHLNNDTPGTDDGLAIGYAEGIEEGMKVTAGTVIGFLGDSGNAESTSPHLHFELHQPDGLKINPFHALINGLHLDTVSGEPVPVQAVAGERGPDTHNTTLVGNLDPDETGFNAGIAVSGDHVYMGTWGRRGRCPGTGVRAIDVSDPTAPERVASFATGEEFPGTGAESLWVGEVDSAGIGGTIGVVGLRLCENNWRGRLSAEFAGLAIYDLTDPANPELLSTVHSGENTQGVHHVDVISDDDRVMAAIAVPQSHLHHEDAIGDIRFLDLSDPAEPRHLSDWDLRRDGPKSLVDELMASVGDEALSGHSVTWLNPTLAVAAHSAAGLITLDLSDPTRPEHIASASPYDTSEAAAHHQNGRGHGHNAHSGWLYDGEVLVQDDQQLNSPSEDSTWGHQVLYDFSDPSQPVPLSTFATENSVAGEDETLGRDGFYSAHTSIPYGETNELVAWFSDGVRVVDLAEPSDPREVAYFVPPPRADPQGWWIAPDGTREIPMVWGVATDDRYVYASDINSGLWIFRVITRQSVSDAQVS